MRDRLRARDIAQLDVEEFVVVELKGATSSLQFGRGPVWLLSLLPQRMKAVALIWEGVFASQRLPRQLNLDQGKAAFSRPDR
jgi:hypothetical protein